MIQAAIEATAVSVPGQQTHDGQAFPLVLACQSPEATLDAAADWVRSRRDELLKFFDRLDCLQTELLGERL